MKIANYLIEKTSLVLGIILIILSVILTLTHGFSYNNFFCFLIGLAMVIFAKIYAQASTKIRIALLSFVALGIIFVSFMLYLIISHGNNNTVNYKEKYAIVLGSGIIGSNLTPMLKERLDTAIEYYQKNPNVIFIVSGGQGPDEDIPEAQAMATYLIRNKIPSQQIIEENQSKNTVDNLTFSKEILEERFPNYQNQVALISTDFHIYRAKQTAKDVGIEVKTLSAPIDFYLRPGTYLREIISILKFQFIDKSK